MAYVPSSDSVIAFQQNPSSLQAGVSIIGVVPTRPAPTSVLVLNPVSVLAVNPSPASVYVVNPVSTLAIATGNSSVQLLGGIATLGSVVLTGPLLLNDNTNNVPPSATNDKLAVVGRNTIWFNSNATWERQRQIENGTNTGNGLGIQAVGLVAQYDDVTPTGPAENSFANLRMSSIRSLNVNLAEVGSGSVAVAIISGSIAASFTPPANQSVSGTVQAEVQSTNSSIFVLLKNSSVTALQGTNPWQINVPTPSYIAYQAAGSVLAVSGSFSSGNSSVQVVGIMPPQSVSGVGLFNVNHTGNGSVIVVGNYLEKSTATTASVTGVPMLFKTGADNSVLSAVSTNDPLPIRGSVATLQGTNPWIVNVPTPSYVSITPAGSVQAVRTDNASVVAVLSNSSVAALQGTNPWRVDMAGGSVIQVRTDNASIVAVLSNSSVAVLQGTSPWLITGSVAAIVNNNIGSIVGTYSEDSAHGTTDKGLFIMQVRNDTMSSITSADGDYSPMAAGPIGETITANSPITKWFSTTASVMYGTSVQVVAAPGASIFTYITGIHVMNESANFSRVTFTQGLGGVASSILTRVAAPATGGSNSNYINGIRVLDNNGISASISGISSVLITITGFNAKI